MFIFVLNKGFNFLYTLIRIALALIESGPYKMIDCTLYKLIEKTNGGYYSKWFFRSQKRHGGLVSSLIFKSNAR